MGLTQQERTAAARSSLDGLSVGDAFGDRFFLLANRDLSRESGLPPAPWRWTDDSEMACSVYDVLNRRGGIDQDELARCFAERFDIGRQYGVGALELLERVRRGDHWHRASRESFDGRGSYGNGAAMRVAPLGAYFADDLPRAAREAELQAEITHAHPEGIAGAIAVALAAAHLASVRDVEPAAVIDVVMGHLSVGEYVRRGLERARGLLAASPAEAARELGNGSRISAQDTVPFALWVAVTHLDDYEAAVRACVQVGGDMDTTAAIIGGLIAAHRGRDAIPDGWLEAREPLPAFIG
ncbi:ADP-ribosylglycohydrolase family protein [Spirillospora sp. CA-294931]|uniref:ADP-ribosylglycohydrolase family protein n=1 Tax=Spirillospora sp. CA-294931 TaxID=3240042 RepID=UPI003D90B72D